MKLGFAIIKGLSWTLTEVTTQQKKGKAMPHSSKEKEIFTVSMDSGSGP